jgi:serine/threonine protein kinase
VTLIHSRREGARRRSTTTNAIIMDEARAEVRRDDEDDDGTDDDDAFRRRRREGSSALTTTTTSSNGSGKTTNALVMFERCEEWARALEASTRAAVSHREKCWALQGQAQATMLALEEAKEVYGMLDESGARQARRHAVSVQGRLQMGTALAEVYGTYTTAQKLVRSAVSWKTNQKFEETRYDLEVLERQLWNLTGASGRLGVTLGGGVGDTRRRLLRGGFGQTIDTIFGSGVLAMCGAGSDGSELWWSTGGPFPRLSAYDLFLQGQRQIDGMPGVVESNRVGVGGGNGGGFSCVGGGSVKRGGGGTDVAGRVSLGSTPVVSMKSAPYGSSVLWTGTRDGRVMTWDSDLGSLTSDTYVRRGEAVTTIEAIDRNRAWVGCEDGSVFEVEAQTSSRPGALKVLREIVGVDASDRPSYANGIARKKNKAVNCILLSNDTVFVACKRELALEIWHLESGECSRVESLEDLGYVVALMKHPMVSDLIVSVHDTGAVQIWGGGQCAVAAGDRILNITNGFKAVDEWSYSPFSQYFGKNVVGAVAVERMLIIGHANGQLTLWPLPGAHDLHEASLHADTLAKSEDSEHFSIEFRSSKLIAHGSGLVGLTHVDGGGSIGVVTVGRFGSIMYWPLTQLEAVLGKVRQPALGKARRSDVGEIGSPGEEKFMPANRTPEPPALATTSTIPYEHLKNLTKIGEGSFGQVYRASWNHIDVAVKFMSMKDIDVSQSSKEFVRSMDELEKEVSIMTQLRHPNIVLLLGVVRSTPAIVVEFCTRGSLFSVLQRHMKPGAPQLLWKVRLQMALGAAAGMLYLHDVPVLHRDLKSANLMVDRYYRVKVGDFGLSRVHNEIVGSGERDGSCSLHSPRWMAPEVLKDGKHSKASDVYSYGIILWEIQSLKTPFKELNVYQILSAVDEGERPDANASFGAQYPEANLYRDLMRKAWDQDPKMRPSFEDIVTEVQNLIEMQSAREYAAKTVAKSQTGLPAVQPLGKSLSFTAKRNSQLELHKPKRTSSSVTENKENKENDIDIAPIQLDMSRADDDDTVVIETPAASPERSADRAKEEAPAPIERPGVERQDILRGMRARNSLNGSIGKRVELDGA